MDGTKLREVVLIKDDEGHPDYVNFLSTGILIR